jgi:hypothetical protein
LGKSGRFHRATLVGKYEPRCLNAKLKALTFLGLTCLNLGVDIQDVHTAVKQPMFNPRCLTPVFKRKVLQ